MPVKNLDICEIILPIKSNPAKWKKNSLFDEKKQL